MSMIGKTLGNFQCTALLGKGGMGEVYKAKDQKLGRDVAIKVLPEEFAKDADRVARFQREAKLLASLNHPNIAAIHGLEESDGTHFLVLELIEGDTLADRIKSGAIPVEESLKLALQIAEALEAAHERGVIHRDLKPANIKVTPDGKVKVLDFGLAKAFAGDQAEVNLSHSPTLSYTATQQGVILGTAAYMPPEQAKGKTVDKRADTWAFGVVLFEMLSGRALFTGETVSETLASVIKSEPEWASLPPNLHSRIRLMLERCLEKDPRDRYGSINDARVDVQKALADPSGVFVQPITVVRPTARLRTILPLAATVLGIIIGGVVFWNLKPVEPRLVTRLYHELPKNRQFSDMSESVLAVSPDGRKIVYCATEGLYLLSLDELDAKLILGTGKDPQKPFFSPDGQWIGYLSRSDQKLKKISIIGGTPVAIGGADSIGPYRWETDDTIVYGMIGKGIVRISSSGGNLEQIIKADNESFVAPQLLPDGYSMLFTSFPPFYQVAVQSLKSGDRKQLFEGVYAQYLPTRHIVYGSGNNLFAIAFDIKSLKTLGGSMPVVEGFSPPQIAISDSGTLAYVPRITASATLPKCTVVWVDRNGREEPLSIPPDAYSSPKISPDGMRLALNVATKGNPDIWIWNNVRKTMMRFTFGEFRNAAPLWTSDSQHIVFAARDEKSLWGIYRKAADGTGDLEHLGSAPGRNILPASWADGGNTLILNVPAIGFVKHDIGTLSMKDGHEWKPLLQEKFSEIQPQISPNGRWMAYTSNESGRYEIHVRPYPDVNKGRWQVSTNGGKSPLWAPNGRELFYRSGDEVMVVAVQIEPTFSFETPKALFRGTYVSPEYGMSGPELNTWDISPDGKRFIMIKPPLLAATPEGGPRRINIVLNWFEELKQKVPVE